MKTTASCKSILTTAIIFGLTFASTSFAEHHEGSGSKKHKEGNGSHKDHHYEGSGSKKQKEGSGNHMDHDAMMAKWAEFSTPNENHKALEAIVGNWDHTVKWWMTADGMPEVSKGMSEVKWIMGGRFIQHTAEGTSMGQPFEGMGIMGYDNALKQYNSIWFDNMGTGFMKGSGTYDASTKTLTEEGTFTCPFRGPTPFRGVITIKDDDHYTYEMFGPGFDGKEFRNMEIQYKRKI